jgi:hypothetical protein
LEAGSASRPVRELKRPVRVTLAAGEKRTVSFALGKAELSFWSPQEKKRVVEAEQFDVWAGGDSTATLHTGFRLLPRRVRLSANRAAARYCDLMVDRAGRLRSSGEVY